MKKITANSIYLDGKWEKDKLIITDEFGRIERIMDMADEDSANVEHLYGSIVPGFINTHCHLELSHLKKLIPTGTGLIPFITSIVKLRSFPEEEILDAIRQADEEMVQNGIVAVGDISNQKDTAAQKLKSSIHYYNFVELFDFMTAEMAQSTFEIGKQTFSEFPEEAGNRRSYVPHAPYSVSEHLFELIKRENTNGSTISIHNQETTHEDDYFRSKSGAFNDFFNAFNVRMDHFTATGRASIYYAMQNLDPAQKTLFVHNTMSSSEEIMAAMGWSDQVFWATCANANLYIENRLPDYKQFIENEAKMTIGTDSLSSNWQLSVLEELKTIKKYNNYIPWSVLIKWATLNGAQALSFDDQFGSIEVGKRPGLVLISEDLSDEKVQDSLLISSRII